MNWFDLTLFSIFAYLGFANAGTIFGNMMACATCLWAFQIVLLEIDARRRKSAIKKPYDDDSL